MKLQALTSAALCGALAVSLLAGCAAKQPASAAAQSTGQKSHLTIMGTEGGHPVITGTKSENTAPFRF